MPALETNWCCANASSNKLSYRLQSGAERLSICRDMEKSNPKDRRRRTGEGEGEEEWRGAGEVEEEEKKQSRHLTLFLDFLTMWAEEE